MNKLSEHVPCRPENLTLYHYGELEPSDRARVESHLLECAACRHELAQLQSVLEVLPKRKPEFSPQEIRTFNARVNRRLHRRFRRFFEPSLGWSLAASTAVLLMMILYAPAPGPQQSSTKVTRQISGEIERLPDPELLLNLELLENLDLLQELEETGIHG